MANLDAIDWLEALPEQEHVGMFKPALACVGRTVEDVLFTVKLDHEPCAFCPDWEQA